MTSLYARGMYWCTKCGIQIKHDDAKELWLNLKNGLLYHEWCGKPVKTRAQAWLSRKFAGKERRGIKRI